MKGGDPADRNWLEVKILTHLNDVPHPVSLRSMRDNIEPNKQESIVCSAFDLKDDGLIEIRASESIGEHWVTITPLGKTVLLAILSGRTVC